MFEGRGEDVTFVPVFLFWSRLACRGIEGAGLTALGFSSTSQVWEEQPDLERCLVFPPRKAAPFPAVWRWMSQGVCWLEGLKLSEVFRTSYISRLGLAIN